MWTDNRYFQNQFPTWHNVLQSEDKSHDEKKEASELDHLMFISSLLSTKNNGIDHIFNYTLNNIIRIYNTFTVKYLNSQQQLFVNAPRKNPQVDGTIYVGIHGFSVLFLRILLLIDTNKLTDAHIEQRTTIENEAKDKRFADINTPKQPQTDHDDTKHAHNHCLLHSDIYCTSAHLLTKFIHDLSIALRCKNINELRRKLLTRIVEYVSFILTPHKQYKNHWNKVVTLVLGKPGILSIAIIVFYITKNVEQYNAYVEQLINTAQQVIETGAYELLYGQIGYIHCIQFIQSFIECYKQNDDEYIDLLSHPNIVHIMDHTMNVGQEMVENDGAPLMWQFHGVKYLGAAHGYIGIIYTLLQMRNGMVNKYEDVICKSLLYLMSIKYDTGNYPSDVESIGNPRCGHLVQWCHGSPSFVSLFAKYYEICGTPKENDNENEDEEMDIYEECMNKCIMSMDDGCEHIWKYGLLTKGRSICHGVSGNAYSFLRVYAVLNKCPLNDKYKDIKHMDDARKYLYYAFQFASFMCHPQTSFFREPDAPDSLFEGVAGECCFTLDLLFNNSDPKFPCYDY